MREGRGQPGQAEGTAQVKSWSMKQQSQDAGGSKEEGSTVDPTFLIDHRDGNGFHRDLGTQEKENLGEEMLKWLGFFLLFLVFFFLDFWVLFLFCFNV